jgi:hypothetical protein
MNYRLMFRSDFEDDTSEIVLTQKMKNFNPAFPAAISIRGGLKDATPLSEAVLSDELEIKFENRQIARIGNTALENVLDFDRNFTIDLKFLTAGPISFDILNAEIIE